MSLVRIYGSVFIFILLSCSSVQKFPKPLKLKEQLPSGISIYGTYSDGCFYRELEYPIKKSNTFKPAFEHKHFVAHPEMFYFLSFLEAKYESQFQNSPKILVGDISRPGGGQIVPHGSHQIGLDIDIFFINKEEVVKDFVETQSGWSSGFDAEKNWWLAATAALDHRVERIFVAPEIKKGFCELNDYGEFSSRKDEVLRRIRPWFGHRDHFHIRLRCPRGETYCFNKARKIEPGNGCAEVASWLEDPEHTKRTPKLDYKPKDFNNRCWSPQANNIAQPIEDAVEEGTRKEEPENL